MRRWLAPLRTIVRRLFAFVGVALFLLLIPVAYVEVACRGENATQTYRPAITEPDWQRREANTYLTYPEWHIVYAYDGLAERLETGDEHSFDYVASISRFWQATCSLMQVADAHGGADGATRGMIHTIGVSFTTEMLVKAAYEETVGRATAWWRGPAKTAQDTAIAETAVDYAGFLRQTPWYQYPFGREARELWSVPVSSRVRGWERRLGIGLEFVAKSAYAQVLASAAAAAPAQLQIRSVVEGLAINTLSAIPNVRVIGKRATGIEIETPRYDLFTRVLVEIARRGGTVREIAGNDDIMVTVTVPEGASGEMNYGRVIARLNRDGIAGDRLLIELKVSDVSRLIAAHPLGDPGLEHVFDY